MDKLMVILRLLIEAFKDWIRDRAKLLGPSIAYYQLLPVAPLVAFVLFISDKVLDKSCTG